MAGLICVFFLFPSFWISEIWHSSAPLDSDKNSYNPAILVGSFVIGGIGACVSALLSFSSLPQSVRIPDQIMNFVTTFVRPVVGGASGLASTLFLLSGAIHLAGISLALLYTVAFAFGFSERLVINSVNRVTTGSNANTKQD